MPTVKWSGTAFKTARLRPFGPRGQYQVKLSWYSPQISVSDRLQELKWMDDCGIPLNNVSGSDYLSCYRLVHLRSNFKTKKRNQLPGMNTIPGSDKRVMEIIKSLITHSFIFTLFLLLNNRFYCHSLHSYQTMISLIGTLALVGVVSAGQCKAVVPTCPIVLDGRVPSTANLATFDTSASPFLTDNVKGPQNWSEILKLPKVPASRFDLTGGQPVEIVINDKSIFSPGGTPQNGFRRAGLIPTANNGTDASTVGVKTFHWSVRQTASKLNFTHEYLNVWHERNDYNGNQFNFEIGSLIGRESATKKNDWKFTGRDDKVIWTGHAEEGQWQNFAITLDYTKKYVWILSKALRIENTNRV